MVNNYLRPIFVSVFMCIKFHLNQKLKIPLKNEKIILGLELQMRGVQINKNCITWSRVYCLCTGHFTNLTPCFGEVKYLLIFYQRPAPLPSQQNPSTTSWEVLLLRSLLLFLHLTRLLDSLLLRGFFSHPFHPSQNTIHTKNLMNFPVMNFPYILLTLFGNALLVLQ